MRFPPPAAPPESAKIHILGIPKKSVVNYREFISLKDQEFVLAFYMLNSTSDEPYVGLVIDAYINETQESALVRELKEELNLDIIVKEHFMTVNYQYPDFDLKMKCFKCQSLYCIHHSTKIK